MKKETFTSLKPIFIILICCIITYSSGYVYGTFSNNQTETMEFARDTGYKQSCVELAYALGMLSDNDYDLYLKTSDKYYEEPNSKNLGNLSELVNRLLKDLPMWDILDDIQDNAV